MKTLLLIRHAKSSWANALQSDYDRPLNERGKGDAPRIGERLRALSILPDEIVASTAKRAAQTAKLIATAIGFDHSKIRWMDKLYHCNSEVFEEVVRDLDDTCKTVFIVAHNPGVTEFANSLDTNFRIDNMPTCGVVGAHTEQASAWSDFMRAVKEVFLFEYPKKLS